MRLAAFALVAAACSGPSAERAVEPAPSPAVEADPMAWWKELKIRGRDYEAKLASIPAERRKDMAIAFLREGHFVCHPVTMNLACGETEARFPAIVPSNDLSDGCLRRRIAIWALEQLDGATIARELSAVARQLVRIPKPETELPRLVIEKVEKPALLAQLIGFANISGHDKLADEAVKRVATDYLVDLAFDHGVDAAFEAVIVEGLDLSKSRKKWGDWLRYPLRRDTGLRVIEHVRAKGVAALDAISLLALMDDCVTYVAGQDVLQPLAGERFEIMRSTGSWQRQACIALHSEGATSPALRGLISSDGLRVETYKDHPNDDDEDRVWHDHRKNNASFKMPFADELKEILPDCTTAECVVPGTTVRFKLTFTAEGDKLEVIERYERLGGC